MKAIGADKPFTLDEVINFINGYRDAKTSTA